MLHVLLVTGENIAGLTASESVHKFICRVAVPRRYFLHLHEGLSLEEPQNLQKKQQQANTRGTSKRAREVHMFQGPGGWRGSALGTARSKDCLSFRPASTELGGGPFQRLSLPLLPVTPQDRLHTLVC